MSMSTSVIKIVQANSGNAARLLARLLLDFPAEHEPCPIGSDRALDAAFLTAPEARDPALLQKLAAIMQTSEFMNDPFRSQDLDPHHPGLSQARHHVSRHHDLARRCARLSPRHR